jgi:hypothetical protein
MFGGESGVSGLHRHDAEQVPCIGVGRIEFRRALVMTLRKTQFPDAMPGHAELHLLQREAFVIDSHRARV